MAARKRLSAACSTILVASGLVVAPFLTGPASAAELIVDGGFEAATGGPPNSPNWTESDSIEGSPLCIYAYCGNGSGASPPRTGNIWAWFGGYSDASHNSSLSQVVVIPVGTASLTYWYRNGTVNAPFDATLLVEVDGMTVKTHTEASSNESDYSLQTIDLSAFANGASHTLLFAYHNGGMGTNSMVVDDVSLIASGTVVTGTPPGAPDTTLTKTPKKKVLAKKQKKSVTFEFSSATAGATFECSIDDTAFTACTSGQKFKLKVGKHTFAVRAVASGQTDPTPATYSFKIKRKN
jgi:hypothetical protein